MPTNFQQQLIPFKQYSTKLHDFGEFQNQHFFNIPYTNQLGNTIQSEWYHFCWKWSAYSNSKKCPDVFKICKESSLTRSINYVK